MSVNDGFFEEITVKKLLSAICASAFAVVASSAFADIYSEMNMQPMTPETTAKMKAEVQAARAQWAAMTPAEKSAVAQSMRSKRIGELTAIERVGQNDDMTAMTTAETAQLKAERDAAQAKYAEMTPEEKAAIRKSAQQKRLTELNMIEQVGQNNDMGREF
jgi:predicted membrane protein